MSEMRLDIYIHTTDNEDDPVKASGIDVKDKTLAKPKTEVESNNFFAKNTKSIKLATAGVSGLALSAVKYHLGNVYTRQGDSHKQDKLNEAMGIGAKAAGVGIAFAAGGIVGGAIALAAWGLDIAKRVDEYNYNAKIEQINLGATRARAGASMNRSR